MGCDIHLHVEIKLNGQWHHYHAPAIRRDYSLFAKMAGVRNYGAFKIEPISQPKGIPDDVTPPTWLAYRQEGDDAHSASWLSAAEIRTLALWLASLPFAKAEPWDFDLDHAILRCYLFHGGHGEFANCLDEERGGRCEDRREYGFPVELEDIRFVFWFDN